MKILWKNLIWNYTKRYLLIIKYYWNGDYLSQWASYYYPYKKLSILAQKECLIREMKKGFKKTKRHDPNPIRFEDGRWWFYDEVWIDRYGPFDTEEEATNACIEYCKRELDNE